MRKLIISLICCLLPALAYGDGDAAAIRDDAPDQYVVVKGDTLWDISARFLNDPWKWPQIWGMNKDSIRDPHWIYPGDIVVLNRATGMLGINGQATGTAGGVAGTPPREVVKLYPRVRAQESEHNAIPSIPADAIEPFLSRPMIIEEKELSGASILVGTYEQRVILGNDDIAYVKGLPEDQGALWQVYRPGKVLTDPVTREVLGHEATYLGDAQVEKFADISTIRIIKAVQEINKGDRLAPVTGELANNYAPHAPERQIAASVISIYGGVSQAGQNAIITLNKGQRDGVENGHVLAVYRKGEVLKEGVILPDVRYGLVFVFRTFDKVAYALVMQTSLPVQLLDKAQNP